MKIETQCAGLYTVEILQTDNIGDLIESTARTVMSGVNNLILDQGLLRMGSNSDYLNVCSVGSGMTTPQPSNTGLHSKMASTNSVSNITNGAQSSAPYYGWSRRTFTFAVGAVVGNVGELAVGWGGDNGQLFSRALTRDGSGNVSAIPVQSNEVLRVTYEHRYYPILSDSSGVLLLTGDLGGSFPYTMRAAMVSDANFWSAQYAQNNGTRQSITAYAGSLGAITSGPTGARVTMSGVTGSQSGTSAVFAMSAENANLNVTGGIKSLMLTMGNGTYQVEFDAPILKDAESSLRIQFSHSWGRK